MKTIELTGAALDYAVAIAKGCVNMHFMTQWEQGHRNYSTDWSEGGPIIERERISVFDLPSGLNIAEHPTFKQGDQWEAEIIPHGEDSIRYCGPTPLIAAMRCYVASKLGDTVDIPENLS